MPPDTPRMDEEVSCDVCNDLGTYPIIDRFGSHLYDITCPECDGPVSGRVTYTEAQEPTPPRQEER